MIVGNGNGGLLQRVKALKANFMTNKQVMEFFKSNMTLLGANGTCNIMKFRSQAT